LGQKRRKGKKGCRRRKVPLTCGKLNGVGPKSKTCTTLAKKKTKQNGLRNRAKIPEKKPWLGPIGGKKEGSLDTKRLGGFGIVRSARGRESQIALRPSKRRLQGKGEEETEKGPRQVVVMECRCVNEPQIGWWAAGIWGGWRLLTQCRGPKTAREPKKKGTKSLLPLDKTTKGPEGEKMGIKLPQNRRGPRKRNLSRKKTDGGTGKNQRGGGFRPRHGVGQTEIQGKKKQALGQRKDKQSRKGGRGWGPKTRSGSTERWFLGRVRPLDSGE